MGKGYGGVLGRGPKEASRMVETKRALTGKKKKKNQNCFGKPRARGEGPDRKKGVEASRGRGIS